MILIVYNNIISDLILSDDGCVSGSVILSDICDCLSKNPTCSHSN